MEVSSIVGDILNMAQLVFQGNTDDYLLVFGYVGGHQIVELSIPIKKSMKRTLNELGGYLKGVGVSHYVVAMKVEFSSGDDRYSGLWVGELKGDEGMAVLYSTDVGLGGVFKGVHGQVCCNYFTLDKGVPSILKHLVMDSIRPDDLDGEFHEKLGFWNVQDSSYTLNNCVMN